MHKLKTQERKPTLAHIASVAGVSKATVSRVLNGSGLVRDDVVKRVKNVVAETGYVHKSPKLQIPMQLNHVTFFCIDVLSNASSFYSTILRSVKEEFDKMNITVDIVLYNKNTSNEVLCSKTNNSQALLILGEPSISLSEVLRQSELPALLLNAIDDQMKVPSIHPDYELGGFMAASYLLERGHSKIKIITSNDRHSIYQRTDGFLRALQFAGLDLNYDDVVVDLNKIKKSGSTSVLGDFGAQELLPTLIDEGVFSDCTAVFCICDMIAFSLIDALAHHKLKVPDDISVIGFDNLNLTSLVKPNLTTLSVNYANLAKATLIKLVRLSNEPDNVESRSMIPVEIVERLSVKDLNTEGGG
ncbi:hypothetical protein ST37_02845 [Vibrio sp. qd031]|uniref:LacI family DNA-binding transcriptional regulator n=1 Tax=Vibrio sp. qd031 TaxID=1603038 RepID=UPI000A10E15C|nr:LacI family DNA-binding transcriptional regulator [Vibrio sp. qd031]ORT52282.1 hypothetical protein ST37_02845 [Vibrio sp. qd031]